MIRADLHNYLLIGFQPTWRRLQGYEGRNLAELMFKAARLRDIGLTAITSEEHEIPKGSVHDRFGHLVDDARRLPPEYQHDKLGENALVMEKDGDRLIAVNGQTVIVQHEGKRYDHLVIGSNQVPNGMSFPDTLQYCNDNGLLHGVEHLALKEHFGVGEKLAEKYLQQYDFVEGHNAQMRWSDKIAWMPKIGIANRGVNARAKMFAMRNRKPAIATSDAHQPYDVGLGYILFDDGQFNLQNGNVVNPLRQIIKEHDFQTHEEYPSRRDWLRWVLTFQRGIRQGSVPDD